MRALLTLELLHIKLMKLRRVTETIVLISKVTHIFVFYLKVTGRVPNSKQNENRKTYLVLLLLLNISQYIFAY